MLRNGRNFYLVAFTADEDYTQVETLKQALGDSTIAMESDLQTKRKDGATLQLRHGWYKTEKQYSSDAEFIKKNYHEKSGLFKYNFYIIKYTHPKRSAPIYLIAAPLKLLARRIFSAIDKNGRKFDISYLTFSLPILTKKINELVELEPRFSLPMVDFYVFGDGGSEDIKITGSDPLKSTVYQTIMALKTIRTAPCAAILALNYEATSERLYEIYFKGILSCAWESDLSHANDLCLVLNTMVELETFDVSAVRPTWVADSHARKLLMEIEEGADGDKDA